MSHTPTLITSSSNYQAIFDGALEAYKGETEQDLRSHPLFAKLETCNSLDAVLVVFKQQIPGIGTDNRLVKWLNPTVNVLSALSAAIGSAMSQVYPPAGVIFTGIGVLLSAATAISSSQDVLADVFDRIENFFRRLKTYIEVPPTAGMTDMIIKIMVEVLSILSIATKEIKQSRASELISSSTNRLGRLTIVRKSVKKLEEAWMVAAQGLKAIHEVDIRVQAVDDKVEGIDDEVRVVGDEVQGLNDKMGEVDGKIDLVIDSGEKMREEIRQVADGMDDQKWDQIRRDLGSWLSPPDPSVNYNTASDAHHEGTALWFAKSSAFKSWKASGSFLWIHGKPGSGKSVLSSSIIKSIKDISSKGSAHIAYFFFDFKDTGKQDVRALLSSLIIQLCHQSDSFSGILFRYHSTHQSGSQQPSNSALTQCLEDILRVQGQAPIYLIIDALDESANNGMPSPRDKVLSLVEKLVKLKLPNLHLCVTSRPEVDIRTSLEPLTSNRISLHDQTGQKEDVVKFLRSVVYSDKYMQKWRNDDKEMVIDTLSKRADGMFRWVFCQLETLRHCLPPSFRHVLAELPETLDGTYERILSEIPKSNRMHARRLLQCLTVAVRPLRVEELAEVLAVNFDATGGIPKLEEDLRWEDQEQAVLSACSSLIAIVADRWSRVVQFSHFSVKEFLTSDRLATSKVDGSRYYHILLEPAHTIMAQACLGVLLRLDYDTDEEKITKFGNVLSHVRDGVDHLLDPPHLAAWSWIRQSLEDQPQRLTAVPSSEDVNARCEVGTPLHAAALNGHVEIVRLLLGHSAAVDARDFINQTPLHLAAYNTALDVFRMLIEHNADMNARDYKGQTPLHRVVASGYGEEGLDVVRFLLKQGAKADAKDKDDSTPLHMTSYYGRVKAAQLLLQYDADIHARNKDGQTALHWTFVNANDDLADDIFDAARFLLKSGADVNTLDNDHSTPLHETALCGAFKAARLLLEHGADIRLKNREGETPLVVASTGGHKELARLLSEHSESEKKR
ncbi:hypothetical protein BJV74DRAFT_951505 [Russula compacta]|nr:hypothetical protein BJV74DRAFT_951505 [Russula compacta]